MDVLAACFMLAVMSLLAIGVGYRLNTWIQEQDKPSIPRKQFSRRTIHIISLSLVLALTLSACTGASGSETGASKARGSKLTDEVDEQSKTDLETTVSIGVETKDESDTTSLDSSEVVTSNTSDADFEATKTSAQDDPRTDNPGDETVKGVGTSAKEKPDVPSKNSSLEVHFLDVGQGASVLFIQDDYAMILDGGDRSTSSFVVAYLKKQGIEKIDVMIATHYDADHISGLVGVLNAFEVDVVYNADYVWTTKTYESYKAAVTKYAKREIYPKMGQQFDLGDMRVSFIAPRQYGHKDPNENSISIRVDYGETSFIVMGDQSANSEQQMLKQDLSADVFYATHHGSNGSNSKTLLSAVSPSFVVISSGADNEYGHPGKNTLNRLAQTGATLYRTDQQGTIIAKSDGKNLIWSADVSLGLAPTTIPKPTAKPTSSEAPAPTKDSSTTKETTKTAAATTTITATTVAPTKAPVVPTKAPDPTVAPTAAPTVAPTIAPTTAAPTIAPTTTEAPVSDFKYVLNINPKADKHVFHYSHCSSVKQMNESNKRFSNQTREEILAEGFVACQRCNP